MLRLLKLVERFQISIQKYSNTESLSDFQEGEGLLWHRLRHGQNLFKLLFTF